MEVFICVMFFIIGTLLGSFFSLATYRIPLKQNITTKRSYCPNCNHKLVLLDLIPIFSYIFLKGRCRYCNNKINKRYITLELLSGIVFLLIAISSNINIYNIQLDKIIFMFYVMIYITTLFIIGGIDKENRYISKSVLIFGIITQAIYIIYLYTLSINIYRYVIYLLIMLVLIILDTAILKRKGQSNYTIQVLTLCIYFAMNLTEEVVIFSIIFSLLIIALKKMILTKNSNNKKQMGMPIGFYLCATNIILQIVENFLRW